MGRAFRVLKRTAQLTVHVSEHPEAIVPVAATASAAASKRPRKTATKKPAATRPATKKAKE
jgi:hypothetical protein